MCGRRDDTGPAAVLRPRLSVCVPGAGARGVGARAVRSRSSPCSSAPSSAGADTARGRSPASGRRAWPRSSGGRTATGCRRWTGRPTGPPTRSARCAAPSGPRAGAAWRPSRARWAAASGRRAPRSPTSTSWPHAPPRSASTRAEMLEAIRAPELKEHLRSLTERAWEAGVRGVPTLRVGERAVLRRRPPRGGRRRRVVGWPGCRPTGPMADAPIRLYGIPMSHPVVAVRGMLDRKGLEYRYVELLAGAHPPSLWALGFRGITVPAIRFADGRRAQGSLAIAAALEEVAPSPSLYPSEPAARAAAQAAEGWGEAVLQPVPRRLIRWGLRASLRQRQWFADVATPLPAPAVTGWLLTPLAPVFVKLVGADDDGVRARPRHAPRAPGRGRPPARERRDRRRRARCGRLPDRGVGADAAGDGGRRPARGRAPGRGVRPSRGPGLPGHPGGAAAGLAARRADAEADGLALRAPGV